MDLLSHTISNLLDAGLTPEELSLYTGMQAEGLQMPPVSPAVPTAAAIRLGKISYLLEDLRKRCADADRVELILRAEVVEASIEHFLRPSTSD